MMLMRTRSVVSRPLMAVGKGECSVLRRSLSSGSTDPRITEVHNSELSKVMHPGNKVLYFTATWCPPCRAIKPIFEKLSNEFSNVQFLKIDIDENDRVAVDYKITSVPTFIFMAGNKPIAQFSGASENALRSNLQELSKK